jgi:hypothetical protein
MKKIKKIALILFNDLLYIVQLYLMYCLENQEKKSKSSFLLFLFEVARKWIAQRRLYAKSNS